MLGYILLASPLIMQSRILTGMVHNQRLAPLGPIRRRQRRILGQSRIHIQVVNLVLAQNPKRLTRKHLDGVEVGQLEGQHAHGAGGAIEVEGVDGGGGGLRVPCTEDDSVGLGLLEELFEGFEALNRH